MTRFAVVGDCTLDVVVVPDRRRRHAGDVSAQVRLGPGGQGANVAVRLARRGERVRLVAPLADDAAGRLLRAGLDREGVAIMSLPADRSGTVIVLIDAHGERTMLSDRRPLDAAAASRAALSRVDWVHCSGYALFDEATGDGLARALGERRRQVRLSVGGGSLAPEPARVARLRERIRSATPQVCILSRDEAGALLGRRSPDPADAAARLAALADLVVVTAGAGGSVASFGGRILVSPPATMSAPAVDATGAGDAYAAALVAVLAAGPWPPRSFHVRRAMAAGGRLGALVARVLGAQARVRGERRPAA